MDTVVNQSINDGSSHFIELAVQIKFLVLIFGFGFGLENMEGEKNMVKTQKWGVSQERTARVVQNPCY